MKRHDVVQLIESQRQMSVLPGLRMGYTDRKLREIERAARRRAVPLPKWWPHGR